MYVQEGEHLCLQQHKHKQTTQASSYPDSGLCPSLDQEVHSVTSLVEVVHCTLMGHLTKVVAVNLQQYQTVCCFHTEGAQRYPTPGASSISRPKRQNIKIRQPTSRILSPAASLPSLAAAPLGLTVVTNIPGSDPTWMLSVPPRMLNPRPEQ